MRIVDFLLNISSAGTDTETETDTNEVMQRPKHSFGTSSFGTICRELAAVLTEFKYFR